MDLWRGFLILLASFGKAVWFFTISTWLPFRSLICTGHLAIHGLTSNLDLMRVRQCASSNASAHPKFDSERTEIKGCHPVIPVITSYHPPLSLSLSHCACKWSWNNIVGIHGRCLEALRKWGIDMQKTSGLEGHSGCCCDRWKQTGCNFQFFSGLSSPLSPAQASFLFPWFSYISLHWGVRISQPM